MGDLFQVAADRVGVAAAIAARRVLEFFRAGAIEEEFEGAEPLQRDALAREVLRRRGGGIFFREHALNLAQREASRIGPEQDARLAVVSPHRIERQESKVAPCVDRPAKRSVDLARRLGAGRLAQGAERGLQLAC